MEVRRNSRFDLAQNVEILFNPITKLLSGTISGWLTLLEYENTVAYYKYTGDDSTIAESDIIATRYFGGRVVDVDAANNRIAIGVPYDAFAEQGTHYLPSYLSTDAFIFSRKNGNVVDEYFYCLDGSPYLQESGGTINGGDTNRITDSFVTSRSIEVNNPRFGYGYQKYNNNWVDKIKLAIPATTPEYKLSQMVNSIAVAIKGENTLYGALPIETEYDTEYDVEYGVDVAGTSEYELVDGYNYYKQYSAGSCSPIIRLVSLDRTTLTFNKRRNVFEIEAVILG